MQTYQYNFIQLQDDVIPKPYLPCQILNPNTGSFINYYGLIDTGADMCCIPSWVAVQIGHNLEAVDPLTIGTAGRDDFVYLHSMHIDVFSQINNQVDFQSIYSIRSLLPCTNGSSVLLGVRDFLENIVLNIDYLNQIFTITLPDV